MEERRSFLGPTVVVGASLRSFSSTLWACSRHRRTTGPVFGWLPWQPPPPRLLHVNKENIGVRADCLIVLSLILFFFFLFPFSFVPFFFSLFFVYLFFFSFCYNFNPLILPGNDDGFFFFTWNISLFVYRRRGLVEELLRFVENGEENCFFFDERNERKKERKVCGVVRFFYVMC